MNKINSPSSTVFTRTGNPSNATPKSPPLGSAARFGFASSGFMNSALGVIGKGMAPIEKDDLVQLVVTDLGGMVFPRTAMEFKERGWDSTRETLFRELFATFSNVYIAGWFGLLATLAFAWNKLNPKGMWFRSWIDGHSLDVFGDATKEALAKGRSPKEVQRLFLNQVLGQLESTDHIPKMKEYQQFFPGKGRLTEATRKEMVRILMGEAPDYRYTTFNLEERVARWMHAAEYKDQIRAGVDKARTKFLKAKGVEEVTQLLADDKKALKDALVQAERQLLKEQRRTVRLAMAKHVRRHEKPFFEALHRLAIEKGGLSDQVFVMTKDGKINTRIGARGTQESLRKIKYYLQEFLTPALADRRTGVVSSKAFRGNMQRELVLRRLYHTGGNNWVQRKFIPRSADGLIRYATKAKTAIVGFAILSTMAFAYASVLINNWYTRKKHGGKVFFPGEGGPQFASRQSREQQHNPWRRRV